MTSKIVAVLNTRDASGQAEAPNGTARDVSEEEREGSGWACLYSTVRGWQCD